MTQHRSVVLLEYVAPHLDQAVGANANEVLVERRVMEFAQRKPIWNPRLSTLPVADDVCGIEKFAVLEATDCALCPIGAKDPLAKRALVKANLQFTSGVSASLLPDLIGDGRQCSHWLVEVDNGGIVDLDREGELALIVPNDKYRPCGEVAPRDKAEEVNQGDASAHEFTEANIIRMVRIGAPIRISEPAFAARAVIVGPLYGSTYRQRQLARRRLENPRHADE